MSGVHAEFLAIQQELERRRARRKIYTYYPDTGAYRRELYRKHLEFFRAGATHRERAAICANRVGKTEGMGGYETVMHLTGDYPAWWPGKRFDHPIEAWASGKTMETTRDIIQAKLLGPPDRESDWGTGLIPGNAILGFTRRRGVSNALDTIMVRHVSGGVSILGLKAYEQGRGKYEGTAKHVIWNDEEPPLDVYTEALMRTMTVDGIVLNTFTPLEGITEVVLMFMPGGKPAEAGQIAGSRYCVFADWDDVPHLDEKAKKELYDSLPPHQREARSKGVPSLGSGAIYPVAEESITVDDFLIPKHWRKAYALDVGWNCTACVWGATDPETLISYLYSAYKGGQQEPVIHSAAIKGRGAWIPGTIDPAARGRGQKDGEQLLAMYQDNGLDLVTANNAVEAGLYDTWTALSTGQLKVFRSLKGWFDEFRLYRRDEKGRVVKEFDHYMDVTRYWWMTGRNIAKAPPVEINPYLLAEDLRHTNKAMCA